MHRQTPSVFNIKIWNNKTYVDENNQSVNKIK